MAIRWWKTNGESTRFDHRQAFGESVDRNRVKGLEGYVSFSSQLCIGKRLRSHTRRFKWLDKRYPFGQRVFGFEIKPSFCVGRSKMRASNTIFYGYTIARFRSTTDAEFLRIKSRFQVDAPSFSLVKRKFSENYDIFVRRFARRKLVPQVLTNLWNDKRQTIDRPDGWTEFSNTNDEHEKAGFAS